MADFNCHVRIFVTTDDNGNIIRSNDKTGHFELQIDGLNGASLNFDGHTFNKPVFSYGGAGVTMYNGSLVPYNNCRYYSYDFTAPSDKVYDFIINKMRDTYLDTDNETVYSNRVVYRVKTGPFQQYNINSTNCFTAVAAWCSWLGYNTLSNIVANSNSYTDYIAWRMYDRYGSAWTYHGQY